VDVPSSSIGIDWISCGRWTSAVADERGGTRTGEVSRSSPRRRAMKKRVATCACGQFRVSCTGDPVSVALCHCLDCQKRTGSVYGIAAFFAREHVEQRGEFRTYRRGSDSGSAVNFHFCPHCGSTVCWEPERKPDAIGVAVGSFADPAFPPPSRAVYDERRHAWVPPLTPHQ